MNIVVVAGEASGDLLGGKLAYELKRITPEIGLSGIGGHHMRNADVNTLFDISETSVIGIAEILKHYPRLRHILSSLKKHIRSLQPDLLILIDYPEFNLKLAHYAKKLGIKVLFYVSPQIWAWRTGRVKKIKQCVDLMAVLLPFEVDFYKKHNIPVCLVRHPLLEDIEPIEQNESNPDENLIGLLPGSRMSEIKRLLPVMLETAAQLKQEQQNLKFIIPVAANISTQSLKTLNHHGLKVEYSREDFYQVVQRCKILAIASGTATLQAALLGKAMVIIYKISPVTYFLFGHLVKVDHIGLANIILGRRQFAELVQQKATTQNLKVELEKLLNNAELGEETEITRKDLYHKLSEGINSNQLAERAIELIKNKA